MIKDFPLFRLTENSHKNQQLSNAVQVKVIKSYRDGLGAITPPCLTWLLVAVFAINAAINIMEFFHRTKNRT